MKTSSELFKELQEARDQENRKSDIQANKARKKLETGVYEIHHNHKQCQRFRGSTVHIIKITELWPTDLTPEEKNLLLSEHQKDGSYYFEGNRLSLAYGNCLFSTLWDWPRWTQGAPSAKEQTKLSTLESFLKSCTVWDRDWILQYKSPTEAKFLPTV